MGCAVSANQDDEQRHSGGGLLIGSCCSVRVLTQSALPIVSPTASVKERDNHRLIPARDSSGENIKRRSGAPRRKHTLLPTFDPADQPISFVSLMDGTCRFVGIAAFDDGTKVVLNGMGQLDERGDGLYVHFAFPELGCTMILGPGMEKVGEIPFECSLDWKNTHFSGVTDLTAVNDLGPLRIIEELEVRLESDVVHQMDVVPCSPKPEHISPNGSGLVLMSPNPALISDRMEVGRRGVFINGSVSWKCWSHDAPIDVIEA